MTQLRNVSSTWLLIPVALVAACLRMQHLPDVGYIFDESFCLRMVEFPIGEMVERITKDAHPPLYYFVLKAWVAIFGNSAFAARMLSVVFGVLAVVGVFLFVREAYRCDPKDVAGNRAEFAAVTAALLVSLSPLHVAWSDSVRMYSMGTALAAISSWLLFRALNRPTLRMRNWGYFTVAAVMLAYTHYFGLFTLAVEYVFACGFVLLKSRHDNNSSRYDNLMPVLISAGCVWFVCSLWIPQFLYQRALVDYTFWSEPLSWERVGTTFFLLFDLNLVVANSSLVGWIVAEICFLLLALLALGRRSADVYIVLAGSVPVLSAVAVSMHMRSVFAHRYLQFAHIFLLIAVAVLLARIPFRTLRWPASLLAIAGMTFLYARHYDIRVQHANLPGMRSAVAMFDEARRPGEPLICCNPMLFTSAAVYSQHSDSVFVNHNADAYPFFQGTAVVRDSEYLSMAEDANEAYRAVWTLDAQHWFNHTWEVKMPPGWRKAGESRFPEFYADLVLRIYVRQDAAQELSDQRSVDRPDAKLKP